MYDSKGDQFYILLDANTPVIDIRNLKRSKQRSKRDTGEYLSDALLHRMYVPTNIQDRICIIVLERS